MQEKYEEAKIVSQEVIKREPSKARGYSGLGKALEVQNKYDKAEEAYQKAIERDPSNLNYQWNLAEMCYRKEDRLDSLHEKVREFSESKGGSMLKTMCGVIAKGDFSTLTLGNIEIIKNYQVRQKTTFFGQETPEFAIHKELCEFLSLLPCYNTLTLEEGKAADETEARVVTVEEVEVGMLPNVSSMASSLSTPLLMSAGGGAGGHGWVGTVSSAGRGGASGGQRDL
jgi:tetratricopeptide (TPR) repeat protein